MYFVQNIFITLGIFLILQSLSDGIDTYAINKSSQPPPLSCNLSDISSLNTTLPLFYLYISTDKYGEPRHGHRNVYSRRS